jgi:integrase
MAKRGHNEGTAFERKDRPGTWRAVFSYTDPRTGKIMRKSFDRPTRKEAMAAGKEWQRQVEENGLLPNADKITLAEWIDCWLKEYVQPVTRIKTYNKCKSSLTLYVKPVLGNINLIKVQSPDIQRVFNQVQKQGGKNNQGISAMTVRITRGHLIACLNQAVKIGLILKNICKETVPPKAVKSEVKPLTEKQAKSLIEASKSYGETAFMAILLALETGMRNGEVFGLKWDCVDLNNGVLTIKRSLATGKGQLLQDTKTSSSRRTVRISAGVIKELRLYRKWQEWQRHLIGDKWQENDFVFTDAFGKAVCTYGFAKKYFKPALEKAGISHKTRFHDLRHTNATLLMAKGVHAKTIQERLGHSDISTTLNTYSHVTSDMQYAAVTALDGVFTAAQ